MRRLLLPLLLLGAAPASRPARPHRIVSLNLCADQLLLALADRDQIVALTRFAADPQMSAAAAAARGIPATRGSAEEVLTLRPDLVVAAPYLAGDLGARFGAGRFAVLGLDAANGYADIRTQVTKVAATIGHPERGRALLARMDRALAAIPPQVGRGATAALYQRRGYLTGGGTLEDELMRRVGLRNLATRLGKPALARVGLEEIALARPDYLLVGDDRVEDRGTELLRHPLLARIPRLHLPPAWTVCGGPAYADAARSLAAQLALSARAAGRSPPSPPSKGRRPAVGSTNPTQSPPPR